MRFDIAIVGGGPHATYALDRIAAVIESLPRKAALRIAIYERSGNFGDGSVHSAEQPRSSYLNRACGDVALAGKHHTHRTSDLWSWYRSKRVSLEPHHWEVLNSPTDTPSRALHGLALRDAFLSAKERIEAGGAHRCHLFAGEVVEIRSKHIDGPLELFLKSGERFEASQLLLTTGHSRQQPTAANQRFCQSKGGGWIDWPYPLSDLDNLGCLKNASVCVEGLGLSAIDVLLYLTEGRGGRFVRTVSGELDYVRGGHEPRYLCAIGQTGLLIPARPRNEKVHFGNRHNAIVLTPERIQELRHRRGVFTQIPDRRLRCQLDFERDILPLIALEMAYVHTATVSGMRLQERLSRSAIQCADLFVSGNAADMVGLPVHSLCKQFVRLTSPFTRGPKFDWANYAGQQPPQADYHQAALQAAQDDLAEARLGNLCSLPKTVVDGVWRDLRPVLQDAIEFGGLTAPSEKLFQKRYWRLYNRLSNGSSIEAMEKVVALVRSNVVDLSHGPGAKLEATGEGFRILGAAPRSVSTAIRGRLARFDARTDSAPLYRNAISSGLLRLWQNPDADGRAPFRCGAIAVSKRCYALNEDGTEDTRISLVGSPIEGVRYFRESLPRSVDDPIFDHFEQWARLAIDSVSTPA